MPEMQVDISVPSGQLLVRLGRRQVTGDVTSLPPPAYIPPSGAKPVAADIIYDGVHSEPLEGVYLVAPDSTSTGGGGGTAAAPESVGATVNTTAGTGTVMATPAAGTAHEAMILGFQGAGAPLPVWATGLQATFSLPIGTFLPFARSVIAGVVSDATFGPAVVRGGTMSITGLPILTGFPVEGQDLTVSDPSVSGGSVTARQWLRNGVAIAGAAAAVYRQVAADVGARLSCAVTFTPSAGGATQTVTSAQTAVVTTGIFVSSSVPRFPAAGTSPDYPAGNYVAAFLASTGAPSILVLNQDGATVATITPAATRFTVPAGTTGVAFQWGGTGTGYATLAVSADLPSAGDHTLSSTAQRSPVSGLAVYAPGTYTITPTSWSGDPAVIVVDQAGKVIGDFDASGPAQLVIPVDTTGVAFLWSSATTGDISWTITAGAAAVLTRLTNPVISGNAVANATLTVDPALYSDGSTGAYAAWSVLDLPTPGLEVTLTGVGFSLQLDPAWVGHEIEWTQFGDLDRPETAVSVRVGPVVASSSSPQGGIGINGGAVGLNGLALGIQ